MFPPGVATLVLFAAVSYVIADDLCRPLEGESIRPELDLPTCADVETPLTGEIDDCLVTVDGNSASSDESPDSGCDT